MGLELLKSGAVLTPRRKQLNSTFKGAGATDIIQLGKQNLYRDIYLRLQAGLTLTIGQNTIAATLVGDEWAILSRIRLVANSTDVLLDVSGNTLYMLNKFEVGARPWLNAQISAAIASLGNGVANPIIDSTLMIPLWMRRMRKPMDMAYESFRVGSLQLELTYNAATSVNVNAVYAPNPTVEISSSEASPGGLNADSTPWVPNFIPRRYSQTFDFGAAQTAGRIPLDTGPYYTHILMNVVTAGGGADLPGTQAAPTVTNIKVVSGTTVIFDLSGTVAMQQGYQAANLTNDVTNTVATGIVSETPDRISASNSPRAWYWIPICSDGYATEAIRNPVANDLYIEVATSAACRFINTFIQIFPNPAAQAA